MPKAVFRTNELITVKEKIIINSPTSFPEMSHFAAADEPEEIVDAVEEYKGPTADDLRREAELFKRQWEDEKEKMISAAKAEAEKILYDAKMAAFNENKKQTDEGLLLKQRAEDDAQRIITEAQAKANELEVNMKQTLETERREALESGRTEGKDEGYAEGKNEVDRLIERTHVILESVQEKRGEILKETEKEIVDLVLLITRKVIKVLSENQRNIIIQNVLEALRKVKSKGSVIIRVNLADLELATGHKQDFIKVMEGAKSVLVMEDSAVDKGGCIIETDFGEIDARIASQLSELESRILEISPIRSGIKENTPVPVIRTANLNADLAATSSLMSAKAFADSVTSPLKEDNTLRDAVSMLDSMENNSADNSEDDPQAEPQLSPAANAALTASAALAAIATMATKGKRESDKLIMEKLENAGKRKTDPEAEN